MATLTISESMGSFSPFMDGPGLNKFGKWITLNGFSNLDILPFEEVDIITRFEVKGEN